MKKWFYVLAPLVMLGLFLSVYLPSREETKRREAAHKQEIADQKAEEAAHKKAIEEKARQDAADRAEQRKADEAAAAAAKQAKWDADTKTIQDAIDKATGEIETYSKQVSDLEIKLDSLHKLKDSTSREAFELGRQVELGEIDRRNAEFEVQKDVELIARRAHQVLVHETPPPAVSS